MSEGPKDTGINAGMPPAQPDGKSLPAHNPAPSRSLAARTWVLLAVTHLIAVGLGAFGGMALEANKTKGLPGNRQVTLETFKKIQPNMEHAEVQALFGDTGSGVGQGNVEWIGPQYSGADPQGPRPKITVTFDNNKVTNKVPTNLK